MLTFFYSQLGISDDTHFRQVLLHQQKNLLLLEKLKQRTLPHPSSQPQSLADLQPHIAGYLDSLVKVSGKSLIACMNPGYQPTNIPYSVKSHIKVKGMFPGRGFVTQPYREATCSAQLVGILEQHGMQPVCTGNVPQGLLGIESANNLFGRAEVDEGWAVGGSSGGDCALVRLGAVPFAVISDSAGSVRIPASIAGIHGFKPTGKRISRKGRIGPSGSQLQILKQIEPALGFASKSLVIIKELCQLTLGRSLKGDDFYVGGSWQADAYQSAVESLKSRRFKVGYIKSIAELQTVPAIQNAIQEIIDKLKQQGVQTVQLKFDEGLSRLNHIFFKLIYPAVIRSILQFSRHEKPAAYHQQALRDKRWGETFLKLKRFVLQLLGYHRESTIVDRLIDYDIQQFFKLVGEKELLKQQFIQMWSSQDLDFLITPVMPFTSIAHGTSGLLVHQLYYGVLFNVLDCPTAALPVRRVRHSELVYGHARDATERVVREGVARSEGHFVGVQVAGRPHQDEKTVAFLEHLQALISQ